MRKWHRQWLTLVAVGLYSTGPANLNAIPRQDNLSSLTRAQRQQGLRDAILDNDIVRAKEFIRTGTSVRLRLRPKYPGLTLFPDDMLREVQRSKDPTLLMYAVAQQQHALVDMLLNNGAIADSRGDYMIYERHSQDYSSYDWVHNVTALHLGSYMGDASAVRRLLNAKASIDVRDAQGRTALYWAVTRGQKSVVDCLIQAHCNVNIPDKEGKAALRAAAEMGDKYLYNKLKHAGASGNYLLKTAEYRRLLP